MRKWHKNSWYNILGCSPFPVVVTTKIFTFQAVDPHEASFATIAGGGKGDKWNSFVWKYIYSQ